MARNCAYRTLWYIENLVEGKEDYFLGVGFNKSEADLSLGNFRKKIVILKQFAGEPGNIGYMHFKKDSIL